MDFKNFKKNQQKFVEKAKTLNKPQSNFLDEREWAPTRDDAGNGEAIIRFLPQKDIDKNPIVLVYRHMIKYKGNFIQEFCPSTWEKPCPVCADIQPLWDFPDKSPEKNKAFEYGRKKQYRANILVVKDPAKPENNGKVFIYRFGVTIYNKILNKINPDSELTEEIAVYDLWQGMNFHLKIKKVGGFPNYDDSGFIGNVGAIAETDDEIEKIYNQIYDLDEFVDPKLCPEEDILIGKFLKNGETPTKTKKKKEKIEELIEDSPDEKFDIDGDEEKKEEPFEPDEEPTDLDDDDWDWE